MERFRPERVLYSVYRSGETAQLVIDVSAMWERRMNALRAHRSQLDPAAGPSTYLTGPGFLAEVEARGRTLGALAGVAHAEGYRLRGPVVMHDPLALLLRKESR